MTAKQSTGNDRTGTAQAMTAEWNDGAGWRGTGRREVRRGESKIERDEAGAQPIARLRFWSCMGDRAGPGGGGDQGAGGVAVAVAGADDSGAGLLPRLADPAVPAARCSGDATAFVADR